MLYPKALSPGDKVAIVSPAGVVDPQYVRNAQKILENWDLEVILGNSVLGEYGRFSGTSEERQQDLQAALDNPEIRAILCSRGGYGTIHLLDKIRFDEFCLHPKWVIGFSDITALHSALSQTGICSLHAPMTSHLSEEGEDEATLYLKGILFGHLPSYSIPSHPLNREGICEGFTKGGNLAVFHGLRGTPFDLDFKNTILFIEDIGEKPYQIERMIYNLKLAGSLATISGLIIGRFTDYEEDPLMNASLYELIASLVSEYDYPVCFNFPLGHIKENYPLIETGKATLEVTDSDVFLSYQL